MMNFAYCTFKGDVLPAALYSIQAPSSGTILEYVSSRIADIYGERENKCTVTTVTLRKLFIHLQKMCTAPALNYFSTLPGSGQHFQEY